VRVVLATTLHDPEGRLCDQLERVLPVLTSLFDGLTVRATYASDERLLEHLVIGGAHIAREDLSQVTDGSKIGLSRRTAVELALKLSAQFVMYCDFDRALHWAEYHPQELAETATAITAHDFTVLGRTPRAYDSHPRVQRDTEAIINHVFGVVSGNAWDVSAAGRGLSRRAAEAIVEGCADDKISTDVSWPMFVQRGGGFSMAYLETEGLEFETADRYPDEIDRAGGRAAWIAQIDADPGQWAQRLDLARVEVEGLLPYVKR
jgi:hypothetical protein